jgi:hypothetical protein
LGDVVWSHSMLACRWHLPSFPLSKDESTLTKGHIGESHFLAAHDGNVRGAHGWFCVYVGEIRCC